MEILFGILITVCIQTFLHTLHMVINKYRFSTLSLMNCQKVVIVSRNATCRKRRVSLECLSWLFGRWHWKSDEIFRFCKIWKDYMWNTRISLKSHNIIHMTLQSVYEVCEVYYILKLIFTGLLKMLIILPARFTFKKLCARAQNTC